MDLPNGRGLYENRLVQVGLISTDPSAAAQGAAIAGFAADLGETAPTTLHSSPPADDGHRAAAGAATPIVHARAHRRVRDAGRGQRAVQRALRDGAAPLGTYDDAPPGRRGRWSAAGFEVWSVGLGEGIGGPGRHASGKSDAMLGLVEEFATLCETFPRERPYVLVVDDVDRYELSALDSAYDRILKTETSRLIGSIETRNMGGYTPSTCSARCGGSRRCCSCSPTARARSCSTSACAEPAAGVQADRWAGRARRRSPAAGGAGRDCHRIARRSAASSP